MAASKWTTSSKSSTTSKVSTPVGGASLDWMYSNPNWAWVWAPTGSSAWWSTTNNNWANAWTPYTAPNGKVYNITNNNGKYSFQSQWGLWTRTFNNLGEAQNAIALGDKAPTGLGNTYWPLKANTVTNTNTNTNTNSNTNSNINNNGIDNIKKDTSVNITGDANAYKFGDATKWWTETDYTNRNNTIIQDLLGQGKRDQADVEAYLKGNAAFAAASPEDQAKTIQNIAKWVQVDPEWEDKVLTDAENMKKIKQEEEYANNMRSNQLQYNEVTWEMDDIKASEAIQKSQDDLNKLKQTIAYLGTQGQPWVSSQALDTVSKQLSDADTTYNNLVKLDSLSKKARVLGYNEQALQFDKQMLDLNDQMHDNVNQSIQDALNGLTAAEIWWAIDTIPKVNLLRGKLFDNLDKAMAGHIVANANDRKLIIDRYNQTIATTEQFVKNKAVVNEALSKQLWYVFDGNGNPIMDVTGNKIQYKSDLQWQYNAADGTFISRDPADPQWTFKITNTIEDDQYDNVSTQPKVEYTPVSTSQVNKWLWTLRSSNALTTSKKQCGAWVNDWLNSVWIQNNIFLDPIDAKTAQVNTNKASVWSVAVFDRTGTATWDEQMKKYWFVAGHVGIVTAVDANGNPTRIADWNEKWDWAYNERPIDPNRIKSIKWYFDPTLAPTQAGTQWNAAPEMYAQYWLLADTSFNPNSSTDLDAKRYIEQYIKNGKQPTAATLYGTARGINVAKFTKASNRASDLFFQATWESLPDIDRLNANKKLIDDNSKVLNKNEILSDTIQKNFDLAINWEITNNVNKNATVVNKILNPIYLALWDPATNQALVSNWTISQEFANLISIRNTQGTTVADKEMASELIKFGTSVEAQKSVVERLKAEAMNIHSSLAQQNAKLYQEIDPLELLPENPNRQNRIKWWNATQTTTVPWGRWL